MRWWDWLMLAFLVFVGVGIFALPVTRPLAVATLRLFLHDPARMLYATWLHVLGNRAEAKRQIDRIREDMPERNG